MLRPQFLTHDVHVRGHLRFGRIHFVEEGVHFPGKIKQDARGDSQTRREQPDPKEQTHFFKMGMTGFRMASKIFRRMEFPVHTTPALASKSINAFADIEILQRKTQNKHSLRTS